MDNVAAWSVTPAQATRKYSSTFAGSIIENQADKTFCPIFFQIARIPVSSINESSDSISCFD